MLTLSRKVGEKIYVGNNITIEVRRVYGNRAVLVVHAPREVAIFRGELVINDENEGESDERI